MAETFGGEFGPVLKEWFRRNEWPQVVAERVARAKGSKIGPWASQMSNTMSGKLEPKPNFFKALGWFNNVILTRDFQGITDRRLMDQLLESEALCHDDGQPFTATDFFSLYLGELEAPQEYRQAKAEITQEVVDAYWEEVRGIFKELALEMMCEPKTVWEKLVTELDVLDVHQDEIQWLQEAMVGLRQPSVAECQRQRAKYPEMPVLTALLALKQRCGGNQDRLGKFVLSYQGLQTVTQAAQFACM